MFMVGMCFHIFVEQLCHVPATICASLDHYTTESRHITFSEMIKCRQQLQIGFPSDDTIYFRYATMTVGVRSIVRCPKAIQCAVSIELCYIAYRSMFYQIHTCNSSFPKSKHKIRLIIALDFALRTSQSRGETE